MIVSEVLDAIDNINSITIESEIDTCRSLLSSYDKMLIIEENYNGDDIDGFKIFQEGEKLDLIKEDLKKQNEGKSTLNKIIFTIPRLIRSIFRLITGKLKKSSEKAKQVSEKYKKVKSEKNFKPAGVIAALALGITIVWKGKDITKYVKDRIGKKKKKPVENKKQSNTQNNGNQKQSEIKKDTDTQAQPPQEDANNKKSEPSSGKKQDAPTNKQNETKAKNENSGIDAIIEDQDFDKFMDELFGNDHPGKELTAYEVFNNDIDYASEQFKDVSEIIPTPSYVSYDTFQKNLYSSISISAYIDLYHKLFKDFNEYIKNLKDYIVKKSETPDGNNIKLTEPNIKKTIADHFEDAKKKPAGLYYIPDFSEVNDEITKIEKQTREINDEINKYLLEINNIHSSENDKNIVPNNYNEIIKAYNQAINECANILNVFIDIMNEWVDATNKITIKMSAVNFNKAELNTNKMSSTNSNIVGYFPYIQSRTYYEDFLSGGLVAPKFIDTNLRKFLALAGNDISFVDQGYRYVIFAKDGYLFFGININTVKFAKNVLEKLGMHIEDKLLRDKVKRTLNTAILFVVNIHTYNDNGVPDMTTDDFLKKCAEVYYKHYRKQWDSKMPETEYIDSNGISSIDKSKSTINGIKTTNNIPNEKPKGSIDKDSGIYVIDKFDRSCLSYFLDQILHKGNTNESFISNIGSINVLQFTAFKNNDAIKNVTLHQ